MAKITKINNGDETYEIEDANAVHQTGDEEVRGVKKFFSSIVVHVGRFLGRNDEAGSLVIAGGKNNSRELNGGRITLYGSEYADNSDGATIASGDGSFITLFGNHQEQVNKGKVVVSAQSEIELRSAVTLTEARAIKRNTDSSVLQIFGGSVNEAEDTSARLLLYGKDHADTPSMAVLRSDDPAKASVEIRGGTGNNAHKVFIKAKNGVDVSHAMSIGGAVTTGGALTVGGAVHGTGFADAILPGANSEDVDLSGVTAEFTILVKYDSWICFEGNVDVADTEAKLTLAGTLKQVARNKAANAFLAVSIPARANERVAVTYANMKTDGSLKLKIHPMSAVTDVSTPYYTVTNGAVQTQIQ